MGFFDKLFGRTPEAQVKKLNPIVGQINALEPEMQKRTDTELRALTEAYKKRYEAGETLDDLLPEAFATVREAGVRTLGMRHYDVQLIGGIVLHQGRIAEMRTGEGKTLVATLASYLNAISGKGVHIVTVNDYLAKRDAEWMGKIHRFLGLSVGVILSQMDSTSRRKAYNSDITYGTNSEFGFDYLRDNMCVYQKDMVQRELNFAIVDEVDSILIDEARTPLIISGKAEAATAMYEKADRFIKSLKRGENQVEQSRIDQLSMDSEQAFANSGDYTVDEKQKTVSLTASGIDKAESFFGVERLSDADNTELNHYIQQSLKANALFKLDVDYVIEDGQIMIVDEFTGRIMYGRRYSEGLHQAIEAKEGVQVKNESKTLATITYQNFFRMYKKLSGMTGTAKTEEEEFQGIYNLDVVTIPTNKPTIRKDYDDVIYLYEKVKYQKVVDEIVQMHATKRPILVGTVSVEKSELISDMLKRRGVRHEVLNAKNHLKEALIIAQAGKLDAVTIATNMAGRGTDILLGGNPDFLARRELRNKGYEDELVEEATGHAETDNEDILNARTEYKRYYDEFKKETDEEHVKVVELGGLHIIGTERHESRRIDNQLRGRAGRQGDPGSTRFFLSLEDDLLRLFGGDNIKNLASKFGDEMADSPMELGMLTKQIENAQKRVESQNYMSRKHVLQYDDVMNKQREVIYEQRRNVLMGQDFGQNIQNILTEYIETTVAMFCPEGVFAENWELDQLALQMQKMFLLPGEDPFGGITEQEKSALKRETVASKYIEIGRLRYQAREKAFSELGINMRDIEREVLLRVVDMHWMDHIDDMDRLRDGVRLQAYAQKDPAKEYAIQGFDMYAAMLKSIDETTLNALMHITIQIPTERRQAPKNVSAEAAQSPTAMQQQQQRAQAANPMGAPRPQAQAGNIQTAAQQPFKAGKQIGRNDPCPCGSGKKYKNCCMNKQTEE